MDIRQFAAIALLVFSPALLTDAAGPLVVHEWGTFTSVQGADGVQVEWKPLIKTDLPDFVYSTANNGGFRNISLRHITRKDDTAGILRMETPVIYFYSDTERSVDVRVSFPTGRITEWYPQAHAIGPYLDATQRPETQRSLIEWNGVRVLAPTTREMQPQQLLRDREDIHARHYYAARATDANLLRVNSPYARSKAEYERDLFYRGLGYRPAPLIVKADDSGRLLSLSVATREAVPAAFVITIERGLVSYQKLGSLSPNVEHTIELDTEPFDALSNARGRLMKEVASTLMEQGLFTKEALAMVDTWKDQWFEEQGTRVLYVLPPAWTEETLPLEISPRADTVVRVMVGRAEVITPAVTRELQRQILVFSSGTEDARLKAVKIVADLSLGRFLEPATTIALGKSASGATYQAASELKMQVNKIHAQQRLAQSAALTE
jgi:hypothetical protein